MQACPDKKTLVAFARGDLAADATADVERHAEQCVRCAKALAALDVNDDLLEGLRDLERAREDERAVSELLRDVEDRTTTTLFGERPTGSAS